MEKELDLKTPVVDDRFSFAHDNKDIHDQKLDTKPRGYFKDAFIRFTKNKASVVAAIIIGIIILFALIVPLATPGNVQTLMDPYYAKKGPRNTALYRLGFDGGQEVTLTDRTLVFEAAKGVAAEFKDDEEHPVSLGESMNSYYQPVVRKGNPYRAISGRDEKNNYDSRVDQYLAIGFKYINIEQKEYSVIKQFEAEKGIRILYPLIAVNDYSYDPTGKDAANYWYKTTGKCDPIKFVGGNPVVQQYSDNLVLEENYARNADNSYKYYEYSGGGTTETAQYKVRVLYYNYYQYLYGREPNYFFGTDTSGYSMIYRLATGVRLSLLISVLVSAINFVIGAIYGAIEGYYGGATDMIMERVSDILNDVPFVVVVTLFQLHLAAKVGSFICLLFAYVMTGWIGTAASVRSQFYRYKNQEYVLAARTLGASDRRIMWKHIFPNTLGTLITSSVLVIPGVIFSESMLSYLGIVKLGGATTTSLGTLLSDASSIWTSYPSLMIFPALVISLLMICFNLFGNGLRDAFNPQLRGSDE
ncbi:MAG: ABC transporter permease [Bacilli bacterium]|nr:ABC transporter permease [Bacilli bacterium]